MTAHKHSGMIKVKADNMELVVLCKDSYDQNNKWQETSQLPIQEEFDYFLCPPKHKEPCLHWLNGGDIEYQDFPTSEWSIIENRSVCSWGFDIIFMQEEFNIRIKPRKEKRWMGLNNRTNITTSTLYKSLDAVKNATVRHEEWQFIEIEIET